jgi:hypothetical protein
MRNEKNDKNLVTNRLSTYKFTHHGRNVVHHALLIMHSGGIWASMFLSFFIIYYA